eukprot:322119-Hanusia_phi.AAC.6
MRFIALAGLVSAPGHFRPLRHVACSPTCPAAQQLDKRRYTVTGGCPKTSVALRLRLPPANQVRGEQCRQKH